MGTTDLLGVIEALSSPKLNKNLEESENHLEFILWEKNLTKDFHWLLELLGADMCINLDVHELSQLLIFYYELKCADPWVDVKDFCKKLNQSFITFYQASLDELLQGNNKFQTQNLFDACLMQLHTKLTSAEFKKYAVLIEVYCSIVGNEINSNITLNPVSVFPVSLLLIDDYVTSNKVKGLRCCDNILKHITPKCFEEGNYYEVLYECLRKVIFVKDIEVTKLSNITVIDFLKLLSANAQINKAMDVYSITLEQLNVESNLYRKVELLDCAKKLIEILGGNCVKLKFFKSILCDNLDMCCTEGVEEILIRKCLECLEEWIKYYWSIWKFKKDYKILSKLIKYLCACKFKAAEEKVIKLLITLISISDKEEQNLISIGLDKSECLRNEHKNLIKSSLNL